MQYIINRFSRDVPDLGDLTDILAERGFTCHGIEQEGKHILVVTTVPQVMVPHLLREWDIDFTPIKEEKKENIPPRHVVLQVHVHRAEPLRNVLDALQHLKNAFKVTDFFVEQCQEHKLVLTLVTEITEEDWELNAMGVLYARWAENAKWVTSAAIVASTKKRKGRGQ